MVAYLLSQGAEPKRQVRSGWTALGYAAVGNHMETVERLRAKDVDAGTGVSELLPIVAERGNIDAAQCLIELGADVNVRDGAPIYNATDAGHQEMVTLLIASNANVNLCVGSCFRSFLRTKDRTRPKRGRHAGVTAVLMSLSQMGSRRLLSAPTAW